MTTIFITQSDLIEIVRSTQGPIPYEYKQLLENFLKVKSTEQLRDKRNSLKGKRDRVQDFEYEIICKILSDRDE